MDNLRVLLVTESSMTGVGRHVLDLAEGILGKGCEVHLIYSRRRLDEEFRQRLPKLTSLRCFPVEMRRGLHLSDWRSLRQVRAYLRAEGPFDIIHSHGSNAGGIARLAGRRQEASQVYTPHCIFTLNPALGKLGFQMFRAIESYLARHTDAIVAVSPFEFDHLADLDFAPDKLHYIPNGIAPRQWLERSTARAQLGLPADKVVVGFLGRFNAQKDPHLMIRSFAAIRSGPYAPYLVMVGTGPMEDELRRLADELGIAERVVWPGYRTAEQTMGAFDIFAMPSSYEGMPYVLLEALAAGLPIVTTDVGGARIMVDSGVNGCVVERHEVAPFAAALTPLVENENRRRRFAGASRQIVENFSAETMVQQVYDLYWQLRAPAAAAKRPARERQSV